MTDRFGEVPAPRMSDAAFSRRREHLVAELGRSAANRRLRPVALVLTAAVLGVLVFAPISGASLAHRVATGVGDLWSTPAAPPKDPAAIQSQANDVTQNPPGVTNQDGTPVTSEARDLLTGLGTSGETLSAFPTSNGTICYVLNPAGGGSCGNLETRPWNTVGLTFSIASSRSDGTRVFGVVADKVTAVSVEIDGTDHPALLRNDGFYYQLPTGLSEGDIMRIVATWQDGSTHTFPVGSGPAPPQG